MEARVHQSSTVLWVYPELETRPGINEMSTEGMLRAMGIFHNTEPTRQKEPTEKGGNQHPSSGIKVL